jgi:membrane-associated protease RseP (regulator of RpoE activity)
MIRDGTRPVALCLGLMAVATLACASLAGGGVETEVDPEALIAEERRLDDLALDAMLAGQERVTRVADRVRIAGADLCGERIGPVLGIFAADYKSIDDVYAERDYIEPFIEASNARLGLRLQPRVLSVTPGMPADRAGMRVNDYVVAIDGEPVEKRVYLDALQDSEADGPLDLTVDRAGERIDLTVEVVMGCAVPGRFTFSPQVNAYALSFGRITGMYFTSGLLSSLPGDDALAVIVGHELAHHIGGHTSFSATSARFEAESDYLGLYLVARAGYAPEAALGVHETFAAISPASSIERGFYAHPASARRSLELNAAIEEIEIKRRRGETLAPESNRFSLDRPDVSPEAVEAERERLAAASLALFRARQQRIQAVAWRLARAGVDLCGSDVGAGLGATLGRARDYGFSSDAGEAFGVGDPVTVTAIAPDSPAERAGLAIGDELLSVDGGRIRRTEHVFERLRDADADPIAISVSRVGERVELEMPRELACSFGTIVPAGSALTTWSHRNRREMIVPAALAAFAEDDDELAVVIGHQLGHQVIGRFRDIDVEPEADAIGLGIVRAAGYDVRAAPGFWDRWAAEQFWAIDGDTDALVPHGRMALRSIRIREIIDALTASPAPAVDARRGSAPAEARPSTELSRPAVPDRAS